MHLPVFVEFPPHFNPAALTYHHDGSGACARGQYFSTTKLTKPRKSPHSNLSSLKVPSDSESSRRPSNISVCTSDYSGRDFENALGGQIRELNLTGFCQEASSPFFKDDEDDDHNAMVHRQIREFDLTWICHQATSPLPPRPPNLPHQEMNFSPDKGLSSWFSFRLCCFSQWWQLQELCLYLTGHR